MKKKTWNFDQKSLKNLEKPGFLIILTCVVVKFQFQTKIPSHQNFFCHHQVFFLLKNINKADLLYLLNFFVLFNTLLTLNLILN